MIDFIKIQLIDINISELENNPELNFCYEVNPKTGEMKIKNRNGKRIQPHRKATYKGFEFIIYDNGFITANGSLHKYWNHGGHNHNDFNLKAIQDVLNDFQERFNIKPHQMVLRQLEIGVNIIPPHRTKDLLKYCFLHGTTPFEWKYNSDEGKFIQAEHSQYIIKIYDKARHYRKKGFNVPHPEIMRFEIKYKKLEKIKKFGIFTIEDLINYGLENFISILVNEWQKVLFYDFTINHKSKLLQNYKNPIYWQDLKNRRSAFYKHKNQLNHIVNNCSENIQKQIENIIRKKGILLTKKGAQIDQHKLDKLDTIKNNKGAQIDRLYILSKRTPHPLNNERICPITKLNISMQKENSFLLSHTGLKYYYNTDRKIYNSVKYKYLSSKWENTNIDTEIKEIAHNIRNTFNNRKIKQNRIYPENQLRLFSLKYQ